MDAYSLSRTSSHNSAYQSTIKCGSVSPNLPIFLITLWPPQTLTVPLFKAPVRFRDSEYILTETGSRPGSYICPQPRPIPILRPEEWTDSGTIPGILLNKKCSQINRENVQASKPRPRPIPRLWIPLNQDRVRDRDTENVRVRDESGLPVKVWFLHYFFLSK